MIDMEKINASKKEVKKFGITFAIILTLVAGYLIYSNSDIWPWFISGAAFFIVTALVGFPVLRPVYVWWMKFAFLLAWINTRVLLSVFFYLVITPTGLLMRLFGKDFLDEKIDRSSKSYWVKKERGSFDPKNYERLF